MEQIKLVCPCHFGLEAVLKKEIESLGYPIDRTEDGRVFFTGNVDAIARANLFLRTAERVLLVAGEFTATSFEELFEKTKALPWESFLPSDARFWVAKASSVRSRLFSPTDIQSIVKKAIVDRMKCSYRTEIIPETGSEYPIRVSIRNDLVTIGLDTSGISLHKRGYRTDTVKAPISETLAAALLMLTPWKADRILVDPFCGSGTFPIEAAMMGLKIAPGLNRSFTAESWKNLIPKKAWYLASEEAMDLQVSDAELDISGFDIDAGSVAFAKENARRAGVENAVRFGVRDVK
ncbi:MAG: class I SAM-dependent RNA methyltransferase, partial [Lachnospiraceae bacterium]|nr:class I SAM-dependent RNA methyltransferase [Lachnospiraceae bacterium]